MNNSNYNTFDILIGEGQSSNQDTENEFKNLIKKSKMGDITISRNHKGIAGFTEGSQIKAGTDIKTN